MADASLNYDATGTQGSLANANATGYTDPANFNIDPNYAAPVSLLGYKPGKKERNIRRQVYFRYYQMRDNDWRTAAEHQWEVADKEYTMNILDSLKQHVLDKNGNLLDPEVFAVSGTLYDDRSHIKLPDSFAFIQTHMQESIVRRSRPTLTSTNSSEEPVEEFSQAVMTYNMNNTNFDYEWFMGGLAAAIRGTAFYYHYYRVDKRWIRDLDDYDEETGELTYKTKEVCDIDDDWMEWLPNEYCYVDEKANKIDDAVDGCRREILNIREFQRIYGAKNDYFNVEYVRRGGDVSTRSIFRLPRDITGNDVEIIHYYNRALDVHWTVANNVVIRDGPIEFKHKEIPFSVRYYYRVPGQFWGMGIPQIMYMLAEERNSIRNLMVDRQNMQVNKTFLHNNLFDLSDDDLVSRPGGLISVDAQGQPLDNVIKPLEYGDVPASAVKNDQMMVEDMVRGTGIDVRLADQPTQQTATAAALTNEISLKRIAMLSQLDELDTIIRAGRLKWSNIVFFYPLGRMDTIYDDREERQEQVFKTISVKGKKFQILDENGADVLKVENITGASQFELDKKMAKYLESSFEISVDASQYQPTSRVVQQTKVTEMFSLIFSDPKNEQFVDRGKALSRLITINDEKPNDWFTGLGQDPGTTMLLAEKENQVMAAGQPLAGTPGATDMHTLIHLMYTNTKEHDALPQHAKQLIAEHIMQEHEANPNTNSAAQAMSQNGLGGTSAQGNQPQANPADIGQLPNLPGLGMTSNPQQPSAKAAGITATNFNKPVRTNV